MMKFKYDEMQKQRRDRIGSQSFFMLVFLMMLNVIVYALRIKWLDYSVSTMLLVLISCGVFKIRVVLSGSFEAPGARVATTWRRVASIVLLAVAAAIVAVFYFALKGNSETARVELGTLALLVVSAGLLLAIPVVSWVRKKKDKDKKE